MAHLLALVAWLALLGASITLSFLAAQHETLPGDVRITAWAQQRPFPGEAFSNAIRAVTTTEIVLGTGSIATIALWLGGRRSEALLLAVGLLMLPLLQAGLKELVDRPRPAEPLVEVRAGFSSSSFPAGHVMSATYLYAFLLWLSIRLPWPRTARLVVGAWAAFVLIFAGPPNVWLGVHWPSDALGGWAWGTVLCAPLLYALQLARSDRG